MLVLLAGLGEPSLVEVAIEVLDKLHHAVHGKPVGVDVEEAHKDADHQAAVVEVLILLHLLDDDDLAVGRRHHDMFRVLDVEVADRAAIEVEHDTIDGDHDDEERPERNLGRQGKPQNGGHQGNADSTIQQLVRALTMKTDFLEFLYSLSHVGRFTFS